VKVKGHPRPKCDWETIASRLSVDINRAPPFLEEAFFTLLETYFFIFFIKPRQRDVRYKTKANSR